MKKLFLYIVINLMFFNVVLANDMGKIGDLEINGISIGKKLRWIVNRFQVSFSDSIPKVYAHH